MTCLPCLPASFCFPYEEATVRSNAGCSLLGFSVLSGLLGNNDLRCFWSPLKVMEVRSDRDGRGKVGTSLKR